MISTIFYGFHIGPPCETWADATRLAETISDATGHKCEPGYDGHRSHSGMKPCANVRHNGMTVAEFRKLTKIATRRGWKITVTGYVDNTLPSVLTNAQVEEALTLRQDEQSPRKNSKLSRLFNVLRS